MVAWRRRPSLAGIAAGGNWESSRERSDIAVSHETGAYSARRVAQSRDELAAEDAAQLGAAGSLIGALGTPRRGRGGLYLCFQTLRNARVPLRSPGRLAASEHQDPPLSFRIPYRQIKQRPV